MKQIILLFIFLVPAFLFAQYPATGNKSRLGYQTTGDGLIWRGVAADTAIKPRTTANAYFQLDTVNRVLRRYIATQGSWQVVGSGGTSIDSLVYSTIKGLNDSIQAEKQTLTFASPLLGISDGNNVDLSPLLSGYVTGSGTNNRVPKWSAISNLTDSNIQDDGTTVSILNSKSFAFGEWTTAGRPTGANNRWGFNTSNNWLEGYISGSGAYISPARAITTGGAFTADYIPFGGTGGLTEDAGLSYRNPSVLTSSAFSSLRVTTSSTATGNGQIHSGSIFTHSYTPGAFTGGKHYVASFLTNDATGATIAIGRPHSSGFNATITSDFSTRQLIFDSGNSGGNIIFRKAGTEVLQIGGTTLSYPGYYYSTSTQSALGLSLALLANPPVGTTQGYIAFRESNTNGYKAAFGHDGNGSAAIYAQRANTNFVSTDMKFRLSGINGYAEFLNNTAGVLLGGGTTAQTPTEANGLIRFNSDSTLYQIYQGSRAFIATRAYARSLVSSLPTTNIYTANGSLTSDRTVTGGLFWLNFASKVGVNTSSPAYNLDVTGSLGIAMRRSNGDTVVIRGERVMLKSNAAFPYFGISDKSENNYMYWEKSPTWSQEKLTSNYRYGFRAYNRGVYSNVLTVSQDTTTAIRQQDLIYGQKVALFGSPGFDTRHVFLSNMNMRNEHAVIFDANTVRTNLFSILNATDSLFHFYANGIAKFAKYGTDATTAAALSKTLTNYGVGFATDGTVTSLEIKRDTTIYVDDADLDFSAAITTAQIASRYNRVIFWMTTTGAAGSDSEITLHTPDANLMQVEYLIHSVDEAGGFANVIRFGSNNAVDSTNGLVSSYFPAAGDGIHIRSGLRSSVYKYRYSN